MYHFIDRNTKLPGVGLLTSDTPAVRKEIFRLLRDDVYSYNDSIWIQLMSPLKHLVDFDVLINEYITKKEFEAATTPVHYVK